MGKKNYDVAINPFDRGDHALPFNVALKVYFTKILHAHTASWAIIRVPAEKLSIQELKYYEK